MKKFITFFLLASLFAFLLLFPSLALEAARQGITLWFDTLLPTLLPFLILSQLFLKTELVSTLENRIAPFFQKIFHCSPEGSFCILCGFLCGYPVGARLLALRLKDGQLSLEEAQHLLSFCNNVSPVFCISYGILYGIGSDHLWPYLLLIYGCPVLTGILTRPSLPETAVGNFSKKQTSSVENIFQLIDVCIIDSFLILIKLCGYLVIFSLLTRGVCALIPKQGHFLEFLICPLLEITTGIFLLSKLPQGIFRTLLTVFSLTFGGFCCLFQTSSVIAKTGLSLKVYFIRKLQTALLALFLCLCFFFLTRFSVNGWC